MNNTPRISVGIPAFNEEQNIAELLRQIFAQKISRGILWEVIVVSDGSTDHTIKVVSAFRDARIRLVDRKERIGLSGTQNEIVSLVTGDVLVVLNADVLLEGARCIDELVAPLLRDDRVGLVGAATVSLPPRTWFESVIAFSHEFKTSLYCALNQGDTIHLCHGRARAFSRAMFDRIAWPGLCPEDSFSYLFCMSKGYRFHYASNARVLFRSPAAFNDYAKQSRRFTRGKRLLTNFFDSRLVRRAHRIPVLAAFRALTRCMLIDPIRLVAYGCIFLIGQYVWSDGKPNDVVYDISPSTKKLV